MDGDHGYRITLYESSYYDRTPNQYSSMGSGIHRLRPYRHPFEDLQEMNTVKVIAILFAFLILGCFGMILHLLIFRSWQ